MGNPDVEHDAETGLMEMRAFYKEFRNKGDGSQPVRQFLEEAFQDETLLLRYLKGRKFRSQYAWDTLRRYAEVRFDSYPETFTDPISKSALHMRENNAFGVLKHRDSEGRRIVYFNTNEWDIDKVTIKEAMAASLPLIENLLLDKDCLDNGLIFVQECSAMSMKHAGQYTLPAMLRVINLYWFAYPIKVKGVYFVNFPFLLAFLYRIVKPFLPKKLKERLFLTPPSRKFDDLTAQISPTILPKILGGDLELEEAVDPNFLDM
ncbi:Retinaldehyde-binding protein 1 [Orchesella cincta]|uniref:Retinaldehyde-binding protein 1 n=1 Tax=Orchesella cincta TaxID=48709 RepID=A0A1D2M7Q3_ORCCI|nr:Retinaldehyde-binding protein 1 [Orchesella cincta]